MALSFFDQQFAKLNAAADKWLGDAIDYKPTPSGVASVIQGFVLDDEDRPAFDGDEPRNARVVLKINRTILPAITTDMRFAHTRLGPGWYRKTNVEPKTLGDYTLFSVQRAA